MDKDRGYAWVILGASTILMCIGPSTITSSGFLFYEISVKPELQKWLLTIFYVFWSLSALLAACFAKQRPRQLSTTGAAIACVGFITSASFVQSPSWLYLTFSVAVGFGLGLSFHTAYLVVMSNFDRYKGLANGACQTCIAIGQITAPFLYTAVNLPRDRFQIKSLTTAVGFLTTLFFVVPTQTNYQRRMSMVGDRNRRRGSGGVSRRNSLTEGVPLHAGFIAVPASNSIPIQNQGQPRTRRRSQYLLAVSTSLLPNIPEEPESTHSTNDTMTSASSNSTIGNLERNLSNVSINGLSTSKDKPLDQVEIEVEPIGDTAVADKDNVEDIKPNPHSPIRRMSEGSLPVYVGGNLPLTKPNDTRKMVQIQEVSSSSSYSVNNNSGSSSSNAGATTTTKYRRYSESQLQRPSQQSSSPPSSNNVTRNLPVRRISSESTTSQDRQMSRNQPQQPLKATGSSRGESIIDFKLLQDVHFLTMAAFSALCTVTIMNFPIVLYFYISSKCEDCKVHANTAMIIIYVVDLISRPIFSYLSDLPFLSRRKTFLIGCISGGVIIAAVPLLKDFTLIYCSCVLYGICLGMLVTSEYLMFIDEFGSTRFPLAYGILNVFKLIAVILIGLFLFNPLGSFLYPIHPLDINKNVPKNLTLICDDLGVIDTASSSTHIRLLISIAVPVILCALAWITEDIYKASQKCSVQSANKNVTQSNSNATDMPYP